MTWGWFLLNINSFPTPDALSSRTSSPPSSTASRWPWCSLWHLRVYVPRNLGKGSNFWEILFFSRKRPRRVLSKKALSLNIVIKHCLKFCWSDGCLERLSSKTAQSSAEVMAVLKDCHQRLPKVLLKWWLSLKIVIKNCPKFCWSDGCL